MKILIISMEVWRNDNNGGNVLTNIFDGFEAEYAQIYCSAGTPDNDICKNYFQMTDGMAIQNILHRKQIGRKISLTDSGEADGNSNKEDSVIRKVKKLGSFEIFRVAREVVWGLSDYQNDSVKAFVNAFDPDIIFAPCYGVTYMLSLTRYVAGMINKPVISYISDDFYTLRQFSLSPVFWGNRFVIRHFVRKTWNYYSLIYTMTSAQRQAMSKLGRPIKILKKSGNFAQLRPDYVVDFPIKIVYGGSVYADRWKTLCYLAEAIKKMNSKGGKFALDIYTANKIPEKAMKILNNGYDSKVHKPVAFDELMNIYKHSDIALHVESFDLKNRLNVRMSFSTKIIDCMDSGCAVMAICDKKQGGYTYLKENDIALCADSRKGILELLSQIAGQPGILKDYQRKAIMFGRKNHLHENILKSIKTDFCLIAGRNKTKGGYGITEI